MRAAALLPLLFASAALAEDAKKIEQVLLLDLDAIDVPPDKVAILNGRVASLLAERTDIETITSADIKTMAKIEADKASAGCEESSCLAEIASALGARYVIYGRVGKLDDLIVLQLNLFDASVGRPVARQETQGAQLKDLATSLPKVVSALLRPLGGSDVGASHVETSADKPLSPLVIAGGALAGVGAVAGLGLGLWAIGLESDLQSRTTDLPKKQFAYDWGMYIATGAFVGAALAVGGGALIAVGLSE